MAFCYFCIKSSLMKNIIAQAALMILLLSIGVKPAEAQTENKLRVYIDCSFCDQNHIREQITFVDYVRDRAEAQVQVVMATQTTGSDGTRYILMFYGLQEYDGRNDTLSFTVPSDATDDLIRDQYVRTIKLGIIPYIYKSSLAGMIDISYSDPGAIIIPEDKWNNWVFSLSGNAYLNGQKSYSSAYIYTDFSVQKVMPEWKTSFSMSSSYNESEYTLEDYYYKSVNRGYYGYYEFVSSISNHWSWGIFSGANHSTYGNTAISVNLTPGIEFDVFPYEEASTRQIRIAYMIGGDYNRYLDTTIYNKTKEMLYMNSLSVSAKAIQKWGSLSGSVSADAYLHDLSKNSIDFSLSTSLRLFKGLELNVSGYYGMIHNQLSLPKGDVSQEELLLQQRQIETQYTYWASIGLSYTFGSIFNTVVNPRFGY